MRKLVFIFLLSSCCNSIFGNSCRQSPDNFSDTISNQIQLDEIVIAAYVNKYKETKISPSLRLDTRLLNTPQNIQIINMQTLKDQQAFSMPDAVVRNVSGAVRLEHWGDLYTHITMRGTRAAAFRNGMNVTSTYGPLSEDMSFVEQIEFVKGPAGFMMANGEPSGIYNIVTKKTRGSETKSASLSLGSFDLYRACFDLDGKLSNDKRILYRLNVVGQSNNSYRDYSATKRFGIAPVVSFQLDKDTKLTTEYMFQYADLPDLGTDYLFSTKGYGTVNRKRTIGDPGLESTKIFDHNVTINIEHNLDEYWKLTAQASYMNESQEGSFVWVKSIDDIGHLQRLLYIWDASNESSFAQAYINGQFLTGSIKHRILGGLDLSNKSYIADFNQSHLMDSIGTFDINKDTYQKPCYGVGHFDRSKSLKARVGTSFLEKQSMTSIYLQDDLAFFNNKLHLTLAGRYAYVKENGYGSISENRRFTPRIGLNYAWNNNLAVYALFDQSFVPQFGKLRAGGDVKPLTGNNLELGIKKDWMAGKWNTTLSIYRIMKNNQLSKDPDNVVGENYVLQFGQTRTQGLEFDLKGEIINGLSVIANYAFTESKTTKATSQYEKGTPMAGFAKHTLNSWLNFRILEGLLKDLTISGGVIYLADRATWSFGERGVQPLPNYFRLDAGLSWNKNNLSINLNIYNVLDRYLYNGGYHSGNFYYWRPELPRNFRLTTSYVF